MMVIRAARIDPVDFTIAIYMVDLKGADISVIPAADTHRTQLPDQGLSQSRNIGPPMGVILRWWLGPRFTNPFGAQSLRSMWSQNAD